MSKVYPRRHHTRFCGEDGLTAAASHAIQSGSTAGYTSPEEWLDAILEGTIKDTLQDLGWSSNCSSRRCRQFPNRTA